MIGKILFLFFCMFTGIVETKTPVVACTYNSLIISRPVEFIDIAIGQSIAVNGVCLSVASYSHDTICFDVLSETFRKTNLSETILVNLERAMPAYGRFEGHVVLGHVDETTTLLAKHKEDSGVEYIFAMPSCAEYLVNKGSIAINGVSLTIGSLTPSTFSVFLIPITEAHTNLSDLLISDKVTIEYDYIAKLIVQKNTGKSSV